MNLHWRTLFFGLACLCLLTIGAGAASIQILGLDVQAEMVTVANTGTTPVDLTGWRLHDQGGVHVFTFPAFTLPGLSWVRIHTGAGTNSATDLFWGPGSDVWNNDGEIATLYDASGVQVSSSDGNQAPIRTVVTTPIFLTPIATTPPGGATMAQAYAYYSAGNAAWSMAWGSSDIGQIRRHLNEAGNHFSLCRDMASKVNDPSNTANLELMQLVSGAYVALSWAALWMYDGSDMYSEGRTLMDAGDYVGAANTFGHASETFQYSQTYFGQATTTLQGISYAGTSFGDGTAYTATIVPILNARGVYTGEFARYAQGWQHTALAYQASATGDQATFRSEGTQAMNLFGSLRTSATFGADASSNYNILAGLLGSSTPVQRPRYIVGIDGSYPPYSYMGTDGRYTGFDVESIQWIAERMGFDVVIVAVPWDGIISALQARQIDMIYSGMTITPERAAQVSFSKPYLKIPQSIAVRSDSSTTIEDILAGRVVIGVQRGTMGEMWAEKELVGKGRMPAGNLRTFDTFPLAIAALLNGQVGATIHDKPPTADLISGKNARILVEIDTNERYGIAVRKEDTQLLETLNRGLDLLMADPYWGQLKEKYRLASV